MLQQHLKECEKLLLESFKIAANAGHPTVMGDSREFFVDVFLRSHLPEIMSIGHGVVIASNSELVERRNQEDFVIAQRDYPKIPFGNGNSAFLIEAVSATVEVKSTLTEDDVAQAVEAAWKLKQLPRVHCENKIGIKMPCDKMLECATRKTHGLFCGLIAYQAKVTMEKVVEWLNKAERAMHSSIGGVNPDYDSPGLDSVAILGKGVIHGPNRHVGLKPNEDRPYHWLYAETSDNDNLLLFYLQLLRACPCVDSHMIDYLQYVRDQCVFSNIKLA